MFASRRIDCAGFTVMEIVIAVAVVAIIAAAISPMVYRHLEDAKLATAQDVTEALAGAVLSYHEDVGVWPFTNADGPTGNGISRLITDASLATGAGPGAGPDAALWATLGTAKMAGDYLFYNNADDDVADNNDDQVGQDWTTTGRGAWCGPYIDTYSIKDPWGHAYVVNVYYAPGGGYEGTVRHSVIVLSAGPNGTWETPWNDNTPEEILGDDVGAVITVR